MQRPPLWAAVQLIVNVLERDLLYHRELDLQLCILFILADCDVAGEAIRMSLKPYIKPHASLQLNHF